LTVETKAIHHQNSTMASQAAKKDLLNVYRKLLRACETYPSKNRAKIYRKSFSLNWNKYPLSFIELTTTSTFSESIREDFRENVDMDPNSPAGNKQIHIAYKGLGQLHQFDSRSNPNFEISLEQNPFPKPDEYVDRRTESAEEMLRQNEDK
jgi:hypothetical protein